MQSDENKEFQDLKYQCKVLKLQLKRMQAKYSQCLSKVNHLEEQVTTLKTLNIEIFIYFRHSKKL